MIYTYLGDDEYAKVAVLYGYMSIDGICKHYTDHLSVQDIIFVPVKNDGKKTPKKIIKACWEEYLPELLNMGIKTLIVLDTEYYKHICKVTKVDTRIGIRTQVEGMSVFYIPSYKGLIYNSESIQPKINMCLEAINNHLNGSYTELGKDIVHSAFYGCLEPDKLKDLYQYSSLTVDIETTGLKHYNSEIFSIAFAWDKHNGYAFDVEGQDLAPLKEFFETYQGKLIFHNASFDVTHLIYNLWMKGLYDPEGVLKGLEIMTRNLECTFIIAYLALNSCAEIELGLKALAHEFTGDYAEDVKDITVLSKDTLLTYNLKDCLATWFVKEKYEPIMLADDQKEVFDLYMLWMKDIIQMQLSGMPLNMERVKEVTADVQTTADTYIQTLNNNPHIVKFTHALKEQWVEAKNQKLKKLRKTLDDAEDVRFNPASGKQLVELLYNQLGLPVLELTETKQPSTKGEVVASLVHHTEDPLVKELLQTLVDYMQVEKILDAFTPAMNEAPYCKELDCHLLFGSFKLGGTKSGRLSSSKINLQQIPSKGKYGKMIKSCFQAPKGYLFVGLDFSSLEDRISALTTKDKNKLRVYTEGYDGHSLRAFSYYAEQMPDIETVPEGIECYKAKVGDTYICFHADEQIEYMGKIMTGKSLYELVAGRRI